jgi:hypothetical protein
MMLRFDKAFERAVRPQARHAGALAVLERQHVRWQSIKSTLLKKELHELLTANGVREAPGSVGTLTTQRVLVAPRAPSVTSIQRHLPKGTAVEYTEGLMTKRELNQISGALRDGSKK